MCLLTLTEKGNDRKRKESRQCRRQLVVRATVFTVSCHSLQRMSSSLFSLSTRLLFVSYSLILEKKTVFLYSFFFTNIWGQHTSIIYILYNTAETGIYEQIQQQQQLRPSSHVITCGTYSIALSSNYLSCLRKTGTYTNEKTRFIEIIIMALSSAYILHIYIYIHICALQS